VGERLERSHWNLCFEMKCQNSKLNSANFLSLCACISEFPVLSYAAFFLLLFRSNLRVYMSIVRFPVVPALPSPAFFPLSPFFRTFLPSAAPFFPFFRFCCHLTELRFSAAVAFYLATEHNGSLFHFTLLIVEKKGFKSLLLIFVS